MQRVAQIRPQLRNDWGEQSLRSAGPHILEGEDDGGDNPDDHQHHGSDTQKPPTRGEVHL